MVFSAGCSGYAVTDLIVAFFNMWVVVSGSF